MTFNPTSAQKAELEFYAAAATSTSRLRTRTLRNRSRALLDLATGEDPRVIAIRYGLKAETVKKYQLCYEKRGVAFLSKYKNTNLGVKLGPRPKNTPESVRAKVLEAVNKIEAKDSITFTYKDLALMTGLSTYILKKHIKAYANII